MVLFGVSNSPPVPSLKQEEECFTLKINILNQLCAKAQGFATLFIKLKKLPLPWKGGGRGRVSKGKVNIRSFIFPKYEGVVKR